MTDIHGHVSPGFEAVTDAFQANFETGNEIGAAFTLMKGEQVLVDIHGGWKDRKKTDPWQPDTIVPVFSTGKAVTALVMAWLVDQDRISYATPISDVWPEFAAEGKDEVTLADALAHRSGVTGIGEEMDASTWFDREVIEARVAAQAPVIPPRGESAYSPIAYGVMADAVSRRVDEGGRTVGAILKEEIAGPREIDFLIGVPDSDHPRIAEHLLPPRPPHLGELNEATTLAFLKPWSSPGRKGKTEWRKAELPAANGHGSARALAQLMSAFANSGELIGEPLISSAVIKAAMNEQVAGPNLVLPFNLAFGCGLMINRDSGFFGPNSETVGHYGFGGSCAFADPQTGLSGSYVMNRQMDTLAGDERAIRLIDAAYKSL